MILFGNDHNPAMRFEGLARAAFNDCGKWNDPFGYAAQDRYVNFVPSPNLIGKRALSTIFIKLIIDNTQSPFIERLKELEDLIWATETQSEIIKIIDEGITILNKIRE